MRSAPVQHRGIALILVLTTIAILAAIGVDFSYSWRRTCATRREPSIWRSRP